MKILFITDLHLCDNRNSPEFEARRLEKLADLIRSGGFGLVFNLGDTVSRRNLLRPGFADEDRASAGTSLSPSKSCSERVLPDVLNLYSIIMLL